MLVDTHCHLHFDAFDPDRDAVIERARGYGIKYLVNVGIDPVTNKAAFELSQRYDFMFHTAGLHPHHSHEISDDSLKALREFIVQTKPCAIGEIGLDYVKSEADPETQRKAFVEMLHLALEFNLPAVVHSRSAFRDTLDIIRSESGGKLKAVMHCFSYDEASLKEVLDLGFLVSFTCNLTFKNAGPLLDVAVKVPLDRFMLETDAPYLAPQIYRGKRNEPSCLVHLSQFLSEKRGISQKELEETTTATAVHFFNLREKNEPII
jgi:TatD DNase family protein